MVEDIQMRAWRGLEELTGLYSSSFAKVLVARSRNCN